MVANYSFDVKNIDWVPLLFKHNISFIDTVLCKVDVVADNIAKFRKNLLKVNLFQNERTRSSWPQVTVILADIWGIWIFSEGPPLK